MKLFLRYLQSKLGAILLFLAFGAVLAFSFVLYRLPAEAVRISAGSTSSSTGSSACPACGSSSGATIRISASARIPA